MRFRTKTEHRQIVGQIQKNIKDHKQFSIKNSCPSNTLRNGHYKQSTFKLNLSSLKEAIEINRREPSIVVEPRMKFSDLCKITLAHGFVPPVVPEFSSITVGGAIMGTALESSSCHFGQVSDTCLEYELILGNGECVIASPKENTDLFFGISGSYGTLAILTSIKIQLVKAEKWVHLHYRRFGNPQDLVNFLTDPPHRCDFIEGIALSPEKALGITGTMSPAQPEKILRQKHPWSKWYIQHVSEAATDEEGMLLKEYLFRFDRGAFWMGRFLSFAAMLQLFFHLKIPKIREAAVKIPLIQRLCFGWAMSSQKLYKLWHNVPTQIAERLFFIHDFYAPVKNAAAALESFIHQTKIFPIWLCPIRGTDTAQFLSPHYSLSKENFLNIGLYGIPKSTLPIPELTAKLEKEIVQFGGRKMLYSFTYYDHESFSKIYDEPRYLELRKKFYAENAFPTLYNKVKI